MHVSLRHLPWVLALVSLFSCGSDSTNEESPARVQAALSANDERILGCEDPSDWSGLQSDVTVLTSDVRVQGNASLEVKGSWYKEIKATLGGPVGGTPERLALSISVPELLVDGEMKVALVAPAVELWWGDLGTVSLAGRGPNQWHRLEFPLAGYAAQVAAATNLEVRIAIGSPVPVLLDAVAFEHGSSGGGSGGAGGESGGTPAGDALVLRFPAGTSFEEVIFGTQGGELSIHDKVVLLEGGSTNVFTPVSHIGTDAWTNLGMQAETGTIRSQGNVWTRADSHVHGHLYTSGLHDTQPGVVVDGVVRESWDLQPFTEVRIPYDFPAGSHPNVTLSNGETQTLAPGAYGAVSVQAQSTLWLGAGTYYFDEFVLGPDSIVQVDNASGTVFVFVRGAFLRHGAIEYSAPNLFNVLYGVTGSGPVSLDGPSFRGILVAPEADVDLHPAAAADATWYWGSFYARTIRAHQARYRHHPFRRTDCATAADCSTAFGCSPSDCENPCVTNPGDPGCYPEHCTNGVRDGNETDVDCGGSCPRCDSGKSCNSNVDCGTDLECGEGNCSRARLTVAPRADRLTRRDGFAGDAGSMAVGRIWAEISDIG